MSALLRLIWSICCFEAGPAQMPYSPLLLIFLMISEFALAWYQFSLKFGMEIAVVHAIVLVGMIIAFIYFILLTGNKSDRFIQTATTLFAVNVLNNLLHLPVLIIANHVISPHVANQVIITQQHPLLLLLFTVFALFYIIALNIWLILITAYVFSSALEKPLLTGLLITIAMLGVNVLGTAFLMN